MEFGLSLNPQAPAGDTAESLLAGLLDQARAADEAGFDLIKVSQHYLSDYVQLQTVPLLGRVAGECSGVTLATGVLLLPLHHPVEIAEQFATLDAMGEVVAGVGAGYRDVEFESFGVPKSERVPRLVEGIELMDRLWTEDSATYDGEFYAVEEVSINPRPAEKPPVWVAANADRAVERAARIADAWFVNPHSTIGEIRQQKERYDAVREERGEDTAVPIIREAFVAPTTEEAREVARPYLESKYEQYIEWGQDEAMEDESDLHRSFEDLAEDRFLLGTPAEVREEAERYERELDASHLIVRLHWPGMPYERARECIELIGDEVIPYR